MEEVDEDEVERKEEEPEEKMEEDKEMREEGGMEEDCQEQADSSPENSDVEDESGLLEPDTEEEGEEDEEEVEEKRAEELLGDDDEVSVEEEVIEVEPKEDRVGEEVDTFEQIKDHFDPISLNQKPNISNLDINSPKDPMELDDNVFNEASNAAKSDNGSSETVTKSTPGSAEITLTEVIEITPLSKPNDIVMQEEEKLEIEEMQEKQEERKEVEERGRGEKKEKAGRSRSSSGATNFGATDMRYREVKTCPKLL